MIQQELHGLHVLLVDSVQQGVPNLHPVAQQQFDHLDVLVLDGDQQRRAAQRVHAVDVDAGEEDLVQHLAGGGDVAPLHRQQVLLLFVGQVGVLADDAHTWTRERFVDVNDDDDDKWWGGGGGGGGGGLGEGCRHSPPSAGIASLRWTGRRPCG